jgi:citrate synthase
MSGAEPTTSLSAFNENGATVRGYDLVNELIGNVSFTEMIYLYLIGHIPPEPHRRMLDAILVTLVDHGIPAGLTARLTLRSAPESLQGAVAAGLLGVGSQFGGVMQNAAEILVRIVGEPMNDDAITGYVQGLRSERKPIPGFGHPDFRPVDPRAERLLRMAEEEGVASDHVSALKRLSFAVDTVVGKAVIVNVTGAISAILSDVGIDSRTMRGIALIARTPGLVGQLKEEIENPIADYFQRSARTDVVYTGSSSRDKDA